MSKHSVIRPAAILLITAAVLVLCASCGAVSYKSVGTCAGFEVYEDELRFVTLQYRQMMADEYGEDIWTDPKKAESYREELYRNVLGNLTVNYAVLDLARDVGYNADDEDVKRLVETRLAGYKTELANYGYDYDQFLAEANLTDRLYRFTLTCDILEGQLIYAYANDLGIIDYCDVTAQDKQKFYDFVIGGGFVLTYHVFVRNDEGEDTEANRSKAAEAREFLVSGKKTISQMVGSNYNEDLTETKPYCFTKGEMDPVYEEAAFKLDVGEISPVVETERGFYVIVRQDLTPSYATTNLSTLLQQSQYQAMSEILEAHQKELSVTLNEYGESLDLVSLK